TYEDCLSYIPNQVYIGNMSNEELRAVEFPYYDKKAGSSLREGKYGEIMPESEFYGLMQICDVFDLVLLEKDFAQRVKSELAAWGLLKEEKLAVLDKNQWEQDALENLVNEEHAEGLYENFKLVGCVKRAHDVDVNLSAHTMLENIVTKASCVLAILNLLKKNGIDPDSIEYVIDCCEEACGDMNQRGGGNFAKAAAEVAGLNSATGSDVRGFCAGPSHALLDAASLVKAGTFRTVLVAAGGCTAKLGMNGKDHVKKGLPILEDCIAGFAVLVTENDGVNPIIRNDVVGRHTVGTGSAPQNVIGSLVTDPLDRAGLKVTDVDKFAPELQNPDITKPAGAGDVPESNFKMIAALAVKRGDIERTDIPNFVREHGLVGWAPTQGHIPSGVPFVGPLRDMILNGEMSRGMIIGKGSLFLGRMTNLFDGVSFLVEANPACAKNTAPTPSEPEAETSTVVPAGSVEDPVIGIVIAGAEVGSEEYDEAVRLADEEGIKTVLIKGADAHRKMEAMLESGEIQGAVTMHYPFPIGVSTVGRVITPATGREMFIANTTGTSDTDRVCGMVKNTIQGIVAAKACGIRKPTVGIANIDGARQTEMALRKLKAGGYDIDFSESVRSDGGSVMRGNDLLKATADVMVMDALTGNLMMKLFSAFNTDGSYEETGYGYGPGIGEDYDKVVMIVSRTSGARVIANAVKYADEIIKNDIKGITAREFEAARKAGLDEILSGLKAPSAHAVEAAAEIACPDKEPVPFGILGVEVMDLDQAKELLWSKGIYAETGMGCTGPVILVSDANGSKAEAFLTEAGFKG
ncbi:MAG: glycine reductase, partial [Firmicutes bacterium]|nr:glycine reductase [Bacillota bacterium]